MHFAAEVLFKIILIFPQMVLPINLVPTFCTFRELFTRIGENCYLSFTIRKGKIHVSKSSESLKYFALNDIFYCITCFTALSLVDKRFLMYDTIIKLDVSQICHKKNLLFCFNSISCRIRLHVPQSFGKSDIISPY